MNLKRALVWRQIRNPSRNIAEVAAIGKGLIYKAVTTANRLGFKNRFLATVQSAECTDFFSDLLGISRRNDHRRSPPSSYGSRFASILRGQKFVLN
jgi:hypothetical protein